MLFTSRRASSHTTDGNAGQWARHATKETDRWIYSPALSRLISSLFLPRCLSSWFVWLTGNAGPFNTTTSWSFPKASLKIRRLCRRCEFLPKWFPTTFKASFCVRSVLIIDAFQFQPSTLTSGAQHCAKMNTYWSINDANSSCTYWRPDVLFWWQVHCCPKNVFSVDFRVSVSRIHKTFIFTPMDYLVHLRGWSRTGVGFGRWIPITKPTSSNEWTPQMLINLW